jgi:S-adenosylmethionine decarboxylase
LQNSEIMENASLERPQQAVSQSMQPFGQSLHVDLYEVSPAICDDLSFCYQLLDDLADFLDMHKQSPPFIFRSPEDQFPDKAGLSGWVPLIESGISIHTLTAKGFVSLDIYTCGDLDIEKTTQYLSHLLQTNTYEHQYLVRGINYHRQDG